MANFVWSRSDCCLNKNASKTHPSFARLYFKDFKTVMVTVRPNCILLFLKINKVAWFFREFSGLWYLKFVVVTVIKEHPDYKPRMRILHQKFSNTTKLLLLNIINSALLYQYIQLLYQTMFARPLIRYNGSDVR